MFLVEHSGWLFLQLEEAIDRVVACGAFMIPSTLISSNLSEKQTK